MTGKSGPERASIRRKATKHVWLEGRLYRPRRSQLVAIPPIMEKEKIMRALRDDLKHWNVRAKKFLLSEMFWCPAMHCDVTHYVKTCDAY